MLPTRLIQAAQKLAQDKIIGRLLRPGEPIRDAPLGSPPARSLADPADVSRGRFIGLGVRRERVRSPAAPIRP